MTAVRYGDVKVGQEYWLEDGEGPYHRILTDEELQAEEDFPAILDEVVYIKRAAKPLEVHRGYFGNVYVTDK